MRILSTKTFKLDGQRFIKVDVRFEKKDVKDFPNCDKGETYNLIIDRDSAGDDGLLACKKKSKYFKSMMNVIESKKRFDSLLEMLDNKGYHYEWGAMELDEIDGRWDGKLLPVGETYNDDQYSDNYYNDGYDY